MSRRTWGMMAFGLLGACAVLAYQVGTAVAAPFTITDPYGGNHNDASTCCSGDVIGELGGFDIESFSITSYSASSIQGTIRFNYNFGDATLSDYIFDPAHPSGSGLKVGDILFSVNGTFKYAVPLVSHDGLTAGDLYSITGVLTSNQFGLDGSRYVWRFDTPVRMNSVGSSLLGLGSVSTSNIGFYEVSANFSFVPGGAFYNDFLSNAVSVQFASAICGNDVIGGLIDPPPDQLPQPVPEPSTWALLTMGLGGIAVWRLRRAMCRPSGRILDAATA